MDQSPAQPALTAAAPEITGEDAHPMGDDVDLHAYAGFDGALRGYDRRQVNKYVSRTQKRIEEITTELTTVRRNEQVLVARVDELSKSAAMCTCDPNKPESAVVGARLRQIIDIATAEADDLRSRAIAETRAMREEAENSLVNAREQAEQATSALEAMLAHRRAAEEAAAAERRAAIEGWAERHVNEARESARRVIERAGAVSSQVIASARWLVDALGAHRDALSEQLGGVQRRIDELPSLEAAAVPGENQPTGSADNRPATQAPADSRLATQIPADSRLATQAPADSRLATQIPADNRLATQIPADNRLATQAPADNRLATQAPADNRLAIQAPADSRPDEASQPVRGVVRMPGAHAADEALPGARPEGAARAPDAAPPGSVARPPAHAAPADTATLNRTWAPVDPRIGGAHRG